MSANRSKFQESFHELLKRADKLLSKELEDDESYPTVPNFAEYRTVPVLRNLILFEYLTTEKHPQDTVFRHWYKGDEWVVVNDWNIEYKLIRHGHTRGRNSTCPTPYFCHVDGYLGEPSDPHFYCKWPEYGVNNAPIREPVKHGSLLDFRI